MGKHWGNPSSEQPIRVRTIRMRCFSGGVCLSLAVLVLGIQGLASTAVGDAPGKTPGTGAVGREARDSKTPPVVPLAGMAATAPAFIAEASAPLAFSRSIVETTSSEGHVRLNLAAAGLKRPPLGSLMAPLEALNPSSPFGLRTSPLTGTAGEQHWGQDYAAACGSHVYAADAGIVRAVGWHPWGGGNRVEVDHGNGLITTYNHLQEIAVKKGSSVRVGEVIAKVGTTGSSTGCHLHFETILNGSHVDPSRWTLIPIRQVDQLGPIAMTSYAPDAGKTANTKLGWAVPARPGNKHVVAGGAQEQSVAATATSSPPAARKSTKPPATSALQSPSTSSSPSPSNSSSSSPSTSPSSSPSPSASATRQPPKAPSPSASSSGSASPSASPSALEKAATLPSLKESPTGTRTVAGESEDTASATAGTDPKTSQDASAEPTVGLADIAAAATPRR